MLIITMNWEFVGVFDDITYTNTNSTEVWMLIETMKADRTKYHHYEYTSKDHVLTNMGSFADIHIESTMGSYVISVHRRKLRISDLSLSNTNDSKDPATLIYSIEKSRRNDMSGGSFDYNCFRIQTFADDLKNELADEEYDVTEGDKDMADALHQYHLLIEFSGAIAKEIEWLFSGDIGINTFKIRSKEIEDEFTSKMAKMAKIS